jgi:DnaK suppressor protein
MKAKDVLKFKHMLESRRQDLLRTINATEQQFREEITTDESGNQIDFNHPADMISTDPDYKKKLEIIRRGRIVLKMTEDALDLIDEGAYGECQSCHGDISIKRLEAMPHAKYCIDCQEDIEKQHRLTLSRIA